MKCSNCKFWRRDTERVVKGRDVMGKNIYTDKPTHYGVCDSDKWLESAFGGEIPPDGVSYWDYEAYSAGFNTGEQFGCIHFEGKNG